MILEGLMIINQIIIISELSKRVFRHRICICAYNTDKFQFKIGLNFFLYVKSSPVQLLHN